MADLKTENINSLAELAASIGDGDYIFIYKANSSSFSKIERSVFMQGIASAAGGSLSPADVIDNLISESPTKALSAKQGKVLKDLFDDLEAGVVITDTAISSTSTRPLQNKVIYSELAKKQNTISDLATIRSNASNAVRSIKVNNGTTQTPSNGNVNIVIAWSDVKPSSGIPKTDLASAVQTSLSKADSALQAHQHIKTINGQSLVGEGNITISGGSGSAQIDVVDDGASVPSGSDICFFADSPLQAEGLFNNLLQNGEENGASYSPRTLYNLGRRVSYNIDASVGVEAVDNMIYCATKTTKSITPLRNRPEIIVSNLTKMADTSDTAYISFIVARPFYTTTNVRINFPTSDVRVDILTGDNIWSGVSNGMTWNFTPYDNVREITLAVKRLDTNYTNTLVATVGLYNGYETKNVKVVFNPTKVFFKSGTSYNGFNPNASLAADTGMGNAGTITYTSGDSYFDVDGSKYCPLVKNVAFDESKFNVFYAVLEGYDGFQSASLSWLSCCTYLPGWAGIADENEDNRCYTASRYLTDTLAAPNTVKASIAKRGDYVMFTHITNKHVGGTVNLNLYLARVGAKLRIKEFGIITIDESAL